MFIFNIHIPNFSNRRLFELFGYEPRSTLKWKIILKDIKTKKAKYRSIDSSQPSSPATMILLSIIQTIPTHRPKYFTLNLQFKPLQVVQTDTSCTLRFAPFPITIQPYRTRSGRLSRRLNQSGVIYYWRISWYCFTLSPLPEQYHWWGSNVENNIWKSKLQVTLIIHSFIV